MNEPRKDRLKAAQASSDGDRAHNDLAQMAVDPDIQREIATINAEFAVTEMDGLEQSVITTA